MKTSGKLTLKGFTIPVKDSVPVILDAIEIEYEATYSIHEMIQALDMIDIIPDKLAGAYRKFVAYQEEFGDVVVLNSNGTSKAADIVKDIIKDMLRHDVEATAAAEEE